MLGQTGGRSALLRACLMALVKFANLSRESAAICCSLLSDLSIPVLQEIPSLGPAGTAAAGTPDLNQWLAVSQEPRVCHAACRCMSGKVQILPGPQNPT